MLMNSKKPPYNLDSLNSMTGVKVKEVSKRKGEDKKESRAHIEYETAQFIKHYSLIAGEKGLRIELDSTQNKRNNMEL